MSEMSYTLYFIIFDICELTRSKYLQYAHNQKLLFIGIFSVEFCLVDGLFLSDFFFVAVDPDRVYILRILYFTPLNLSL